MDFWLSEIYFCLPAQTIMMVSCECLGACYATKKKKYNINTFWAPSIKCTVCVFIISSNIFFYFSHVWKKILCFYSSLFSSWHLCICYPQTSPKTLQLYTGLAQAITYRLGRTPCIIEPESNTDSTKQFCCSWGHTGAFGHSCICQGLMSASPGMFPGRACQKLL